jgi:16S rRNA processing protein RimM
MTSPQNPRGEEQTAGSPPSGEPAFLAVGKLRRPHGVGGEILMDVLTGFPERLRSGKKVFVGDDHQPYTLASVRKYQISTLLVRFRDIETAEDVGLLRNQIVYVSSKGLPRLPEGEYYHHELLGMSVLNEAGEFIGVLDEILETGANDVYLIRRPTGEELLIPAIPDVILAIDPKQKEIHVRPPEYL